ncbi:MAG: hypothetical protein Q9190_003212 [Brigantiaea leucoxantha]
MADQSFDVDMFTTPFQLTKSMHRDIYPAVEPTNPQLSAKGKTIIITGAGGGLGAAIAKAWARSGAGAIVLVGRHSESLDTTSEQISKIDGSIPVLAEVADISKESSVKSFFAKIKAKFGKAHVLVNCAGSMGRGITGNIALESWWGDFETNVKGTFLTIQSFIQTFGDEGTIINLVSTGVALALPGISSYACSKLAVIKLGQSISLEHPNLRVFSLHPGIVEAADRGMIVDDFTPFAKDTQALTGGVSLWLDTPRADFLKGGFLSVNWDVNEMEAHASEISQGKLTELAFLNAKLGPEGHSWGSK